MGGLLIGKLHLEHLVEGFVYETKLGTVLAFMMSVTALSLPEMIILRNVLKPKLIGIFVGIVALAIIMVGYIFNDPPVNKGVQAISLTVGLRMLQL